MPNDLRIPPAIIGLDQATGIRLTVAGKPVAVYPNQSAWLACWRQQGQAEVVIDYGAPVAGLVVRPASRAVESRIEGARVVLLVTGPAHLRIEVAGRPGLYLVVDQFADPAAGMTSVRQIEPGVVTDLGVVDLHAGETLVVPDGAAVRAQLHAADAQGVQVLGGGIILGCGVREGTSPWSPGHRVGTKTMLFERCHDLRIEGVSVVGTGTWTLHLSNCEDVAIQRFRCFGWNVGSDGIDVMGSRRVRITDCLLHDNDDNVAVKGLSRIEPDGRRNDGDLAVRDVLVEGCVLWNDQAGNAMEIGFETRDSDVSGVIFRDCDVIGAHGEGAVFSIHNGDHATVSDILWEDIRVEHFYDHFIDFRVLASRWSRTPDRGHIRDITLRRIRTCEDRYNTPSLIGGWDADHAVDGVHLQDLVMGERRVLDPDGLQLFTRHARNVTFS